MRSIPGDIDTTELQDLVHAHWEVRIDSLDYFPHGGGAYHWLAEGGGERWFVTVDDLDTKPWLGADRQSAFVGLLSAYQTALELRRGAGLTFVVAPEPEMGGSAAVRLSDRYSVALFRFAAGKAGRWGQSLDTGSRFLVVQMLTRLHNATPAIISARRRHPHVPGRRLFEGALGEVVGPWRGGPGAEPLRRLLADHLDLIAGWFHHFDELAEDLARSGAETFVTHGEPHPGNLIHGRDGFALLDWDTVALDRPERDLWMLDDATGAARAAYQQLTGRALDPSAIALYRLAWKLTDLAAFTAQLRASHGREQDLDTEWALRGVDNILAGYEPSPYGVISQ